MNKKDNQRVRLTKMLLKNGLISLLQSKPIYSISVSELCETAELNRSTFYKYYGNVQDILTELEEETLQKGKQCIKEMNIECKDTNIQPLYHLLCYIQENQNIYKLLFNNSTDNRFQKNVLKNITELLRDKEGLPVTRDDFTADYLFQYLVSGCIGIIQKWLNEGVAEEPLTIAELIYDTSVVVLKSQRTSGS